MPISYLCALEIIDNVAREQCVKREEIVPLLGSIGRVTTSEIKSLYSLPAYDTSAMDGYAIESRLTMSASPDHPVKFEIVGTMAAGASVFSVQRTTNDVLPFCVEIMTGAQFPSVTDGPQLDACIPIERVHLVEERSSLAKYIIVTEPVRPNQHRRFMGSDIAKDAVVVSVDTTIQSQHIMSLTALGISRVAVAKNIHVTVCATGSEVVAFDDPSCLPDQIRDSNSPYIKQVLQNAGLLVTQYRPVPDDISCLRRMLRQFEDSDADVLVTSGGVSAGKFDFLTDSLEENGAIIRFHKVAVRPGHPVLFATTARERTQLIDGGSTDTNVDCDVQGRHKAIFGLPGNPIAAAACLQFFVIPFLDRLRGKPFPRPIHAKIRQPLTDGHASHKGAKTTQHHQLDVFRHGRMQLSRNGYEAVMGDDQASYKTGPIMSSNCWIWTPAFRLEPEQGDTLPCFPFVSSTACNDLSLHQACFTELTQFHTDNHSAAQPKHIQSTRLKVLVLAGGFSSRMKTPKHLLCVEGRPMYQILIEEIHKAVPGIADQEIYISLHSDAQAQQLKQAQLTHSFSLLPNRILTDVSFCDQNSKLGQIGPAAGLLVAHKEDASSHWLVVACDYPLITRKALSQIIESHRALESKGVKTIGPDITCFVNKQGFHEPLLAIWTPLALRHLRNNVEIGIHGPSKTIADLVFQGRCNSIEPLEEEWLRNTNTPEEWEAALSTKSGMAHKGHC